VTADLPAPARLDEVLTWAGRDDARLHEAYLAVVAGELALGDRQALVGELGARLGGWPLPDTPADEVLAGVGRHGIIPARLLAREVSRPAAFRRPALVDALRALCAALGEHANTAIPTDVTRSVVGR
jgi:hypothetical protein